MFAYDLGFALKCELNANHYARVTLYTFAILKYVKLSSRVLLRVVAYTVVLCIILEYIISYKCTSESARIALIGF